MRLVWCLWIVGVYSKTTNQYNYPACPIRAGTELRCCDYGNGIRRVFRKYTLPTATSSIQDYYTKGWKVSRQVNFPEASFTPSSPSFNYFTQSCYIDTTLDASNKLQDKLVCTDRLVTNRTDSTIFWDYPGNPRNNNASCPSFASFKEIQSADECESDATEPVSYYFHTYTETPLMVFYCFFVVFFVFLGFWVVVQQFLQASLRQQQQIVKDIEAGKEIPYQNYLSTPLNQLRNSNHSIRVSDFNLRVRDSSITQHGYQDHPLGQFVFYYLIACTIALNLSMVFIIFDYYQSYSMVFFNPDNIMFDFMINWFMTCFWLLFLILFQKHLRNWFRYQVPLDKAKYVYFFQPKDEEIMLIDHSIISRAFYKLQELMCGQCQSKKPKGYEMTLTVHRDELTRMRFIEFQHIRYVYSASFQQFVPGTVELGTSYHDLLNDKDGLTTEQVHRNQEQVGKNEIDLKMPSMVTSLMIEFFTFFYLYQLMAYYVWFYLSYYNLAALMVVVIAVSAFINIKTKRQIQASILLMTKGDSCSVKTLRDGKWAEIASKELVPGDVIEVEENTTLPCDIVILHGSSVCDESMLTGESMPVQKYPIPNSNELYDAEGSSKKYTLFAGTALLSSGRNEKIIGMVQTTGAHTSKGELIRNILFPIPIRFKYDEQLKFLMILLGIYGCIACYFVVSFLTGNGNLENKTTAFAYSVFMFSTILSPLLPVVITVGQVNAAKRLKDMGIYSLNTKRIALSGKTRVFCFDKTGTLTKQGLDFLGFQSVDSASHAFVPIAQSFENAEKMMEYAIATCHSLGSLNGNIVGNQVEMKMFAATNWQLIEREEQNPQVNNGEDGFNVLKRFEFDHHRMTMSVIVHHLASDRYYIFCKGSYERIRQLCVADSVPSDYLKQSEQLAKDGCYVLAIGYREISAKQAQAYLDEVDLDRDAIEQSLSMLGLILFRNELKSDTKDAIGKLKLGDTRCVMITGDNAMCGCYIARASGMIREDAKVFLADMVDVKGQDGINRELQWIDVDTRGIYHLDQIKAMLFKEGLEMELAVTGKAFDYLIRFNEMPELLMSTRIFSRMTPDQKVQCVQLFMQRGIVTGMCGDGGNDCGALRIAHVGIALSDAEASVVSPFTSKTKTITSVVDLCREGRGSVATSFASVKFLITYGFIASTLRFFQYYHGVILSEWCYILTDGVTLVGLSYVITLGRPLKELGPQRPTSSLLGVTTLSSLLGQELINVIYIICAIHYLQSQDWYCPFSPDGIDMAKWWLLSDNAIATCLFFCVVFQQQTAAFVFSLGSQFRLPVWRNYMFVGLYLILIGLNVFLVLSPPNVVIDLFRIASSPNVVGLPDIPLPFDFRARYLAILFANLVTTWLYEYFIVQGPIRNMLRARFHNDRYDMKL